MPNDDITNFLQSHQYEDAWWLSKLGALVGGLKVLVTGEESDLDWKKGDPGEIVLGILQDIAPKHEVHYLMGRQDKDTDTIKRTQLAIETDDGLILAIQTHSESLGLDVLGMDFKQAAELGEKLLKALPKKPPVERPGVVPIVFWHHDEQNGARHFAKDVTCPSLSEIQRNYNAKVFERVDYLANLQKPDEHGKIILWHGPPGCGKTYAVRALARRWTELQDVSVEVVLDPETLFGKVSYLYQVLLGDNGKLVAQSAPRRCFNKCVRDEDDEEELSRQIPVRLIVLEDSTELFAAECRGNRGFARFQNLTDGLVGQGLRCVFMLTSNETIEKVDPAVRRAGRCLQMIEFSALDRHEAEEWLATRSLSPSLLPKNVKSIALADLYALSSEQQSPDPVQTGNIGFGGS